MEGSSPKQSANSTIGVLFRVHFNENIGVCAESSTSTFKQFAFFDPVIETSKIFFRADLNWRISGLFSNPFFEI